MEKLLYKHTLSAEGNCTLHIMSYQLAVCFYSIPKHFDKQAYAKFTIIDMLVAFLLQISLITNCGA